MKSSAEIQDYLKTQFALDPVFSAESIISNRNAFRGFCKAKKGAGKSLDHSVEIRLKTREKLKELQNDFWKRPQDQTLASLIEISNSSFPELALEAKRMSEISLIKTQFDKLGENRKISQKFLLLLQKVLLASRQDALGLREGVMELMADYKGYAEVYRTAKRIKKSYSRIYRLEEVWLEQILRWVPPKKTSNLFESNRYWIFVLAFVLLRFIVSLFEY